MYSAGTSDTLGKTKALNLVKPEDTGTNTLLSLYVHFPTTASRPEDHSRKPEI